MIQRLKVLTVGVGYFRTEHYSFKEKLI